ncbi:radical SAM protein [Streptomyces sp. ODS28]|uniref:radical SAM protein n=1 Tax=Streptomyces sp. ODS28 TaxID=3136688 RepID=UPI0031E7B60B
MPNAVTPEDTVRCVDPTTLHLILLPTEQCNFRCTYCYEDFPVARMRAEVVQGVKALVSARAEALRFLDLSWFGGEPLLARPVVLDISAHCHELTQRHPEFRYSSSMTTNGYLLTEKVAGELVEVGVRTFYISLDGPPEIHDTSRLRINGKGSFARIWANLQALSASELDCSVVLRVHYTPDTYMALGELIDMINADFGEDPRFSVYFKDVERLGGANDAEIRLFTEEANEKVDAALNSRLAPGIRIYSEKPNGIYVCYAARANSLIVRPDGRLGKCTVALYDERNTVGSLYSDGTLAVDQERFRPWLRGLKTLDPYDLGCPYTGMNAQVKPEGAREDVRLLPIVATS